MRDPLLERGNVYLAASRRAGDAAREEARTLTDAADVVSELAQWCRHALFGTAVLENRSEGHDLSDLLALPPGQSPSLPFELVRDADRRQSLQHGFTALLEDREHDRKAVAAWLFGQALANAFVEEFTTANKSAGHLLPGLWNLVGSRELIYRAFGEALPKLLRESPSAFHAILSELNIRINDINRDPGIGTYSREQQAFNAFVDAWRSNRSLGELWKARDHWFPLHYELLGLVPFILPVDGASVLALLDRFDFPHPIRQIFQYDAILHDRDQIAAALAVAPVCSDDNRSWNHRLSALLLLETAEHHCHDLWRAACSAKDPDKGDPAAVNETTAILSSWLEALGRIVTARPDGQFLGPQWLLLKTIDERTDRARRAGAGDQHRDRLRQDDLIEWIARGFSKAGLVGGAIAALVEFPGSSDLGDISPVRPASPDSRQTSVRLGAFSMMTVLDHMIGNASPDDVWAQLDRLDALLAVRDPDFETEAILPPNSGDLPANSCGFLLALTGEPAARWRQSWGLLVEQRRRAQHWRETQDGDALAPALFLLAAGTSSIDWLMSPSHCRRDKARELWREVFDGARDCWLTISLGHVVERVETHIGRLFARHPMVFGDSEGPDDLSEPDTGSGVEDYSELLARDLAILGGNDLLLAICCLNASYNGATPATMDNVLKGNLGQIGTLLRLFERWQAYERPVRRRTDIVDELASLRVEIEHRGQS